MDAHPHEYSDVGDPVTANFSYIRWIGDRKGIEQQTIRWDRVTLNLEHKMQEWIRVIRQLLQRGIRVFGFFNIPFRGFAPGSVRLITGMWERFEPEVDRTARSK